jgi:glutamate synthase (NADPH) small chain
VGIKSIEYAIVDKAWENGWVTPQPPKVKTGKRMAVIGSAGLACSQQLACAGHDVVLFDEVDRVGGMLSYGIPDFKTGKHFIDRRVEQMYAERVEFLTNQHVGRRWPRLPPQTPSPVAGARTGRCAFRDGFLPQQNKVVPGDKITNQIMAIGKHVVVIGGSDTGSDCVGMSNRHGAKSIAQFE